MAELGVGDMVGLFTALVILAAIPSVSVLAVTARAAASGFVHGVFTTLGIVVGDIIFILLAILGLSVLAQTLGGLFVLVKYVGGAYLIWLGVCFWLSLTGRVERREAVPESLLSSFSTGLFLTLADQKAILFYLGFLPAFVDLAAITWLETGVIVVIATVAVGGVKLVYAWTADRAGAFLGAGTHRLLNRLAGGVMIVVGVWVIAKA